MALVPGSSAGPYRIVEPLGRGGMASVYKAYEPALDRYVALKVLPPEFLHDPSFGKRFRQEAQVIAKLEHPNIVPIYAYDIDQAERIPWMAMRLISGDSLSQLLKRERLAPGRAVAVLRGVADALDYAHAKKIVHRDVKPQNVLLDQEGRVYLADFGIAKMLESSGGLTATGMITGTPQYMAPEQATATKVGPPADIYALGIVAYEMFTGRVPFSADTPVAVLMKHIQEPLPLPPPSTVPEPLLRPVLKCTSKRPEDRWPSAGAFVTALEAGLEARTEPALGEVPTVAVPRTVPAATVVPPRTPPAGAGAPPPLTRPMSPAPAGWTQPLVSAPPVAAPRPPTPARRGGLHPAVVLSLAAVGLVTVVGTTATVVWLTRGPRPGPPSPAPTAVSLPATSPPGPTSAANAAPTPAPSPIASPRGTAPPLTPPGPLATRPVPSAAARGNAPPPTPAAALSETRPALPAPAPAREPAPATPPAPTVAPEVQRAIGALGQTDANARWRAAEALGAMGVEAAPAVPALTTALGDRSETVRWRAAEALGRIGAGARSAVPALTATLGDRDPLVHTEAAKALGLLGTASAEAVPALAEGLRSSDVSFRREAARALGRISPAVAPALRPLIEALKDKDKFVRMESARALGRMGAQARDAVPALTVLVRDPELLVSREAAAALRSIGGG